MREGARRSTPLVRLQNAAQQLSPTAPRHRRALEVPSAEPFIKWAGGKGRIMHELVARLPPPSLWTGRYIEPFLGGGAVYLHLQPSPALLTDTNAELIHLYSVVRDDVEALIERLGDHTYDRDHYYAVRAQDPEALGPIELAARFVFLNRTCFNGLYRVNRQGRFNVPFGRYTNPNLCPADRLRAASSALGDATLSLGDFEAALDAARPGDFVYLDPPYAPLTPTANFTAYTADDFGLADQRRLADRVHALTRRGVLCMVSNSDTPLVRDLYKGLRIDGILAPRAISRDASRRGPAPEVIVRNWR